MIEIILANFGFWFNIILPFLSAGLLYYYKREYIVQEFFIQIAITISFVSLSFLLFFSTTTDLLDTEYWNTKIVSATKYEKWTEKVEYTESYSCGSYKHPKTCTRKKTRRDFHPEYYEIRDSNNEMVYINRGEYLKLQHKYGSSFKHLHRLHQVSYGDGNKYVVVPSDIIPMVTTHSYTNYVVAVKDNVLHDKVLDETLEQYKKQGIVVGYPSVLQGKYGEPILDRVINPAFVPIDRKKIEKQMNLLSVRVGKSKQANPILYIVKNESPSIVQLISVNWNKGKKNDVVLIINVDDENNITWADTICYTNNSDFEVEISNNFNGLNVRTDGEKIISIFGDTIIKSYVRKPMEEFSYLKENITLDFEYQLLIFLLNFILTLFVSRHFLRN